jgi:hypothetical protein
VDDSIVVKIFDTFHYLLDESFSVGLLELFTVLLEEGGEIPLLTVLGNDVHVRAGLIDIIKFNNTLMMNFFHDFDFRVKILQVIGVDKLFFIDNFNSNI